MQVSGYLVATKMPDNEETCPHHDRPHLDGGLHNDTTMGDLFRFGHRVRHPAVHRGVAQDHLRGLVLSYCQHDVLLHIAHDIDHNVLRIDLDQGMETEYTN